MKKEILIIIPVLNEVNNIFPILNKISKILKNKKRDILFIDDNSSDGTRKKIFLSKKKYKKIFLIKRPKKMGIGSAHKDGLKWGYRKKYRIIITMDCDGTHDPIYINKMLRLMINKKSDIISTNRFLNNNSLKDWTIWRKIITSLRHSLIKILLGMHYDSSGAFRCYLTKKVKIKDILKAKNNSYSFFWESMFILSKKYRVNEIPIKLPGRLSGSSKMKFIDILKALFYLLKIFFQKNLAVKFI